MSEASDDVYDSTMRQQEVIQTMRAAGCRPCPLSHGDAECPLCHDLGWLDKDNKPCEP